MSHSPSDHSMLPLSTTHLDGATTSEDYTSLMLTDDKPNHAGPSSSNSQPPSRRIVLALLLATSLVTLVFTAGPVLFELPQMDGVWYVGNDIVRLLEPIIAMPLYFALLVESKVFDDRRQGYIVGTVFMIFAGIYQQGAGFHSASNMFKHPFKEYMDLNPSAVATDPFFADFYYWLRTVWEHGVSHYLYAAGGVLMSMVLAYVYRDVCSPQPHTAITMSTARGADDMKWNMGDRVLWGIGALLYGLIIGSVAINFPKGSIVALVLILAYGAGVVGTFVIRKEGVRGTFALGRRYVLQWYLTAYTIALIVVIGWIIHAKGFDNREEAGIKF
ncbi:hypothetical protein PhCBS80983_g03032 [Powellomyces hirtus]|uniref:Uncharacterized protein n=1 Tax=Powellomyces hirtus TaxID=109895 RepID=A0A507E658_9FUNG|nr:hypothetical protein PhCBS80983_g03032 [Powellomyces hirtus]